MDEKLANTIQSFFVLDAEWTTMRQSMDKLKESVLKRFAEDVAAKCPHALPVTSWYHCRHPEKLKRFPGVSCGCSMYSCPMIGLPPWAKEVE